MIASLPGRGAAVRDGVFLVVNHARIPGKEGVKRCRLQTGRMYADRRKKPADKT